MRVRGQFCAVTQIIKEELGFSNQVHRLATYVGGNMRKSANCERKFTESSLQTWNPDLQEWYRPQGKPDRDLALWYSH